MIRGIIWKKFLFDISFHSVWDERKEYNEKKKLFSNFHSISLFRSFNEVNEKTIILFESFNGEN